MVKIILSGEIGWDIFPDEIREKLNAANGEDLDVHIASPGGGVMSGIEIFNLFRDYKRNHPGSQILATIKGLAASMASYLAMNPAFDLIAAEDNAVFMIHNASGSTWGDHREMLKTAEILDGLTNIIGKAYAQKTKKHIKEIREMMNDESWFFGDEILKAGFVDEMIKSKNKAVDKNTAIASAKMTVSNLSKKINESDNEFDTQQIAAIIVTDRSLLEWLGGPAVDDIKTTHTPANAGKNTEEKTMTLEELMAENPAARIEFDNKLKETFNAGVKVGHESLRARMKAAAVFLSPDSKYPATVKSIAIDVLNGDKTAESLQTTAAAFDALKEAQNSDNAAEDSADLGDTAGQQLPDITKDGVIRNNDDFAAEINRTKKLYGMEV